MAKTKTLHTVEHGSRGPKYQHSSFWFGWPLALKIEAAARAAGVSYSTAVEQMLENTVSEYKSKAGKTELSPSYRGKDVKKVAKKVKAKAKAVKKVAKVTKKPVGTKTKKVLESAAKAKTDIEAKATSTRKARHMTPEQRATKNKKDAERRAAKKVKAADSAAVMAATEPAPAEAEVA